MAKASSLNTILEQLDERLNGDAIRDTYQTAIILRNNPFTEEVIDRVSKALGYNLVSWMIKNGYKPISDEGSIMKIFAETFDFDQKVGIGVKLHIEKEDKPVPWGLRTLLELLHENERIKEDNQRLRSVVRTLRPLWLSNLIYRITGLFNKGNNQND